ncbi:amino acid ABC transporter substrate-binding protein (PAAT family) [Methylovirgula ligni]|uniref:Amino acid ABC transporter substrate-binding protein (PAAT family) n=1 Tax=Methylovirgula ligni TaxID=569860 RepID=A0A3D9YX56_9HYPH|nr:quinoprotein dehydrogenase-associated putative ABC transporter substrate-binding protein [Methylovirgula ligni]REF87344.1 amino acid ABC transporter substrate-binding protein (PAAT family) [Methylovirgula ligni]
MKPYPRTARLTFCLASIAACLFAVSAVAATQDEQARQDHAVAVALSKIDALQPLTAGDRAALKGAARRRTLQSLRICGDPGNLPFSNDRLEGYENKIAEILAKAMDTHTEYYWRPYIDRGMLRETYGNDQCDVLMDLPLGFEGVLLTEPLYKTTFVLASRADRNYHFKSLEDPALAKLRIGVYQTSAIRQVFHEHGMDKSLDIHTVSHDSDINPKDAPIYQVQQVLDGSLDVAAVWGPFAGYYKAVKKAPITIQAVNLMEDQIPLEFELAFGVPTTDRILKYKIDLALEDNKAEIEKVLRDYGVPLVQCSECVVQGDLPAHGEYAALPPTPAAELKSSVTIKQLESWLAAGADVNEEFSNAVTAGSIDRVTFLLSKGADPNKPDDQGELPLVNAVQAQNMDLVKLLLDHGAKINAHDANGMTALLEAVIQDNTATIKLLASRGADLDARTSDQATPLALAIVENKMQAALALIDVGAPVNTPSGELGLTPLMVAAGRQGTELSLQAGLHEVENLSTDPRYPGPLQIARALIAHKADLNAVNKSGVTALMLAAAHNNPPIVGLLLQSGADPSKRSPDKKTALDFAVENGNDSVISLIRLIQQSGGK